MAKTPDLLPRCTEKEMIYNTIFLLLALWPPGITAFVLNARSSRRNCPGRKIRNSPRDLPIRRKIRLFARAEDDNDCDDLPSTCTKPQRTGISSKGDDLGGFEPEKKIPLKRDVVVGDPQLRVVKDKEMSVTSILKELAAIQQQGPQKYCILGTRHCSFLHQQIIELLAYALVLSGNHVYTSGSVGTHAAAVRGALRAERPDLLTVVLPQSMHKQPKESQDLLKDVTDLITMPQNDEMGLDVASRICNSYLLSQTDQLVSFAFHDSTTVLEANKEAKKLDMLVTTLYLD